MIFNIIMRRWRKDSLDIVRDKIVKEEGENSRMLGSVILYSNFV